MRQVDCQQTILPLFSRTRWTLSTRPLRLHHCTTSSRTGRRRHSMNGLLSLTTDEVHTLIGAALCKTCQLDPVPIWLVKDMRGLLSPCIVLLFNKSLATGCFPSVFKNAVVRPLLKKMELDDSQLKNYIGQCQTYHFLQVIGESRSEPAAVFPG